MNAIIFKYFRYYNTANKKYTLLQKVKRMTILERLQEKIEQWKKNHEALKEENAELKGQLENVAKTEEGQKALKHELEEKVKECRSLEESIAVLELELEEKDQEIEKIITQVESLLA